MHHGVVLHHVHVMLGSSPQEVPQLQMLQDMVSAFVTELLQVSSLFPLKPGGLPR